MLLLCRGSINVSNVKLSMRFTVNNELMAARVRRAYVHT